MSTIITDPALLTGQATEDAQPRKIGQYVTTNHIHYDGHTGQIYKIWLLNFLMNIITLGIYSFWGKTRLRQYVAGAFSLNKDRFEYTGTGKELFLGFLKAIPLFLVLYLPYMVASFMDPEAIWPLVLLVPLFYVFPIAIYSALRYRMNRTNWRSIRFGLDGSAIRYANLYLWRWFLDIVSLGILIPYSDVKRYRYLADHASYGNILFRFEGRGKDLMFIHLATYSVALGLLLIAFYGFQLIAASFAMMQATAAEYGLPIDEAVFFMLSETSLPGALAYIMLPFILFPLVRLIYKTALIHEMTNHLYAGDIGFRSTVTTTGLIKLKLGNFFILMCTLGLGMPYIMQRNLRFFAQHTQVRGDLETSDIKQVTNRKSSDAEGLQAVMGLDSGLM
ncbi:MAG: DUF898 domain-containing protein [Nitrosomonas sp.]|nr:DUF898 domain-containing protein [Nitrosomonas sp.]